MLEIVLPFGLPPDELAKDLIKHLQTPALSKLLAGARAGEVQEFDPFSPLLPDEIWQTRRLGAHTQNAVGLFQSLGLTATLGYWFIIDPIHLHVARDHLVLTDPRQLHLTEHEAKSLFAIAQPYFADAGLAVQYGNKQHWLVQADAWADLQTCGTNAACGHNIEIWMPKGNAARAWRKLQNEIQMAWFEDPINQARQARGALAVNSLWLWGGAQLPQSIPPCDPMFKSDWQGNFTDLPDNAILYADALIAPALASDWSAWLEKMQELDQQWLTPALNTAPRHRPLRLILCHNHSLRQFDYPKFKLSRLWKKSGLGLLLPPSSPSSPSS
jgi:hypothetical protein